MMSASYEKNMGELKNKLERLSKNCKRACFVQIKNKWVLAIGSCCANKCLDEMTNTKCIKGNGFVKLIDDENIKYINCESKGFNKYVDVYAKNNFTKPKEECNNYSLFYFEIKVKIEGEKNGYNWINPSLKNCTDSICLRPGDGFSWNDGDIFGCGLVYPPTDKLPKKLPYIFFTQNGNQIGKAILLRDNFDPFKPYVCSRCCSAEANFGNNLETKPFCYDITKNFVIKEFYQDIDVD
uniref:Uncharacterized protein n=1 Tax=Meloidogyne enterolobii TaxID=390850 RepID=A0A6V7X428_MELEN|nr:unnamed protein product [Meloidogyne enterolobii]